ncbi:TadA family conjugal transfer-associated ATPase [Stackebrandtia nassauensis]|uniref:Type II secretion system protein E n=1 Tax=Stackebrandtia nassauensis (strain DSM 44728 / CIP 108903 / NRRL B-16338 / NBRC 102104 / LLR-40K-21) TaxID=446470 RepID=D3PZ70_STANL|nr:TadA family conjugal transfer-associated ATPase [Stackebrandtia nassauensis]ADD45499.1 type II secretion system protein E [Stackebrandtia nassauensis DSM 44728]
MTSRLVAAVRRSLSGSAAPITPATVAHAVRQTAPAPLAGPAVLAETVRVDAELTGAGPLQPLLDDPHVTDVLVNGPHQVWADRGHGLEPTPVHFADEATVRRLAVRLAAAGGRRLDDAHPYADVRLPDGTRLHAVLPPIAVNGPHLSLRTHRAKALTMDELTTAGTLTPTSAALLSALVAAKTAFIISGGTGSGKTTLLASLLGTVDPSERIVIVEDATELAPAHPHALSLQSRHTNIEGAGAVSLRHLVRQALRMRPDRIVVGECRGAEVIELLTALNTGHDGCAGTLHANTATDVPARLAALALPHGLPRAGLHALVAAALRVIVHMDRKAGRRIVGEIALLSHDEPNARLTVTPAWNHTHGDQPGIQALHQLLANPSAPTRSRP